MCLTPNMYKIVTLKTNAKKIVTVTNAFDAPNVYKIVTLNGKC